MLYFAIVDPRNRPREVIGSEMNTLRVYADNDGA